MRFLTSNLQSPSKRNNYRISLACLSAAVLAGCAGGASVPSTASAPAAAVKPQIAEYGSNVITNHDAAGPSGPSGSLGISPDTSPTPSAFVVTFRGNVAKDISTSQMSSPFNPFCQPSDTNSCPVAVSYEPSNNTTTATYTGHPFDLNGKSPIGEPPVIHAGIIASGSTNHYAAATAFVYGPGEKPVPSNFIIVNPVKVAKSPTADAQIYIAASLKPGAVPVLNLWKEIGYVPGGKDQPKFTFTNYGTQTLYVQSSGIILNQPVPTDPACAKLVPVCKEDYAILATLNVDGSPPPGYPNSQFIPLQYPPAKVLEPEKL